MQPEEREMLARVLKVSEENNRMLKSLRRSQIFNYVTKIIYIVLIVAGGIASYYFLQSFLGGSGSNVMSTYQELGKLYLNGGQ